MSSGRPRRGPEIVVLVLILAFLVGCSSGSEPVSAPASPSPVPTERTVDVVVEPSPTVVESTVEPSLADAGAASVTTVDAGVAVEDRAGSLIAVHSLGVIPTSILELVDFELFGESGGALAPSTAFLDVSWCTAGYVEGVSPSVDPSGAISVVADVDDPLGPADARAARHPVRDPAFVVAEPGTCVRGWAMVELDAPPGDDRVARYVHVDPSAPDEPDVYQWRLGPTVELGGDSVVDTGFSAGERVSFNEGGLAGTTVTMRGWAELIGVDSPVEGTRLVGVLAEVCPANEDWPELGLAVEGWNLLGPVDPADRLGADPLAPLSGSCFEDWAEFAVPLGLAPSGFFVADGLDPFVGFARWSLTGAAIEPPS